MEMVFPYRGFEIQVDELERPYFQAAASGRLIVQVCGACSVVRYPPSHRCAACGSSRSSWEDTDGKGRVTACLIVEHSVREAFPAPYAIGLVQLDDLVSRTAPEHMLRILSAIHASDGESLADPVPDGTAVEAFFQPLADGYAFPEFRLAAAR